MAAPYIPSNRTTGIEYDQPKLDHEFVKCVLVGDSGVGKTKLICARASNAHYKLTDLMHSHVPTVWAIDRYTSDREVLELSRCEVDGVNVSLRLWDTFGYHDKDRQFAYQSADVVILCFSVVRAASFKHAKSVWLKEIKKFCPNTPIIVVGSQIDLRYLYKDKKFNDMDKGPFFREIQEKQIIYPYDGRTFAESINASYYEASVLTGYGITDLFDNAIRAAILKRNSGKFWISGLKRVQAPLLQEPQIPPEPSPPVVQSSTSFFRENISEFLTNGAFHDIIIQVENQQFNAHKLLISCASVPISMLLTNQKNNCTQKSGDHSSCERTTLLDSDSLGSVTESRFSQTMVLHQYKDRLPVLFCRQLTADAAQCLLHFIYSGELPAAAHSNKAILHQLLDTADILNIHELYQIVSYYITQTQPLTSMNEIKAKYLEKRSNALLQMLQDNIHTDIVFHLENGQKSAHRIILAARCDFMKVILSDNDFRENISGMVEFPDVQLDTFNALLRVIYTAEVPDLNPTQYIETIEFTNRLCLHDSVQLLEVSCVQKLQQLHREGRDVVNIAVQILEPAQFFNAYQLSDWCLHFLSTNYLSLFKRNYKDLCRLDEINKDYLIQQRWPPLWYLKELDFYQKSTRVKGGIYANKSPPLKKRKSAEADQKRRRSTEYEQRGCLCFASRASTHKRPEEIES